MQSQRTSLIQTQQQKLSPQMIQSIRLMALPIQELKEEIQLAIEKNPALELVEDRSIVSLDSLSDDRHAEGFGGSYGSSFDDPPDSGYNHAAGNGEDSKRLFLEGAISTPETLQDHLLWQLRLQPLSDDLRAIGELLIQNLDESGFHKEDPPAVCHRYPTGLVAEATSIIQRFDPAGCCTANYKEALLVQIEAREDSPRLAREIVIHHLELLEQGRTAELLKKGRMAKPELEAAIAFIKRLNPFPGREYAADDTRYVTPDVHVHLKDDEFVITLNEEQIPVLGINRFFGHLAEEKHDRATDSFVRDNIREAKWFIQSIHQRNRTLLKMVQALVEFQRSFFLRGPKYLAPLTLKDIAREVGVHETTISRIAGKKYIQTDFGLFELRYFFTNSISGSGSSGSRYSKEGVKQIIKEIIVAETDSLSDQDITNQLAQKGIKLARRTVAKYRGELRVDSSFSRKHP
ncbi:MAG: RNA polymerase sigma-54 factor [Spirochaetes bacterium GWD1_61_31]|nr:MAG: RNA polymerase sigma-54 factor [Spirochaetes bacterium GWB1_60_80]OHD33479.1 MAG: RNA polymerase sigma-54 factor [Spirochaetes bacterium GWC1_61_12]OHD34766.1 MAG: RNA polymerase sigma-54 factor [Spirochaetes bacterium GWD1_61_31]OHD45559.1 MAG: RNA polymerase sigma-54 factor [Spirochaetes bacterium GWE1_60_18]OHD58131.1 MAG: RNA polymerase sigma-54 factor [Spirochaetes bacterium GWF1_60_12]HAP44606.1 RNA polymerase sigma-54 factor [Spirochaetaceae bacterium]